MANCPVCNSPLEPGARFCSVCGTPAPAEAPAAPPAMVYCPSCGRQNTADSQFCELCGAPLAAPAAGGPGSGSFGGGPVGGPVGGAHTAKKVRAPGAGGGFKLPSGRILLFGGIGLAAVVVIVVVILLLSGGGGGKSSNNAFYIKDKELYSAPLSGKSSEQITSSLFDSSSVDFSDSVGSRLSLFTYLAKDGKTLFYPDRISSLSSDGYTLYFRTLGSKNDDGTKIDTNVMLYTVNDKTDTVTYLKDGGNIYQYSLKKNSKEKLTGSAETFRVDGSGSRLVFLSDEDTLYSMVVGKDKVKIDSDVTGISYVSDDCKTVFYMKDDVLYKKAEGKDKEKLSSDVYDVIGGYDSGELYYRKYDEDSNLVLNHMTDNGSSDSDRIRSNLEGETIWGSLYTICYYDGKTSTVLTETSYGWSYSVASDSAAIIYLAVDEDSYDAPRLADFDYYYDAIIAVDDAIGDALTVWTAKGGKAAAVSGNFTDFDTYQISRSGKTAWFLCDYDDEDDAGTLYQVEVGSGKAEKKDDDVYHIRYGDEQMLVYFKNYQAEDSSVTLFINGKKLEDDVSVNELTFNLDEDKLLFFTDYDRSKERGTLHLYSGGKAVKVADDVHSGYFAPDDSVLYLSDYSTSRDRGDLFRYDGGKSSKIDDDVNTVLTFLPDGYRLTANGITSRYRFCF